MPIESSKNIKIKIEDDDSVFTVFDDCSTEINKSNIINAIELLSALESVTTDHDLLTFDSDSIDLCLDT